MRILLSLSGASAADQWSGPGGEEGAWLARGRPVVALHAARFASPPELQLVMSCAPGG